MTLAREEGAETGEQLLQRMLKKTNFKTNAGIV